MPASHWQVRIVVVSYKKSLQLQNAESACCWYREGSWRRKGICAAYWVTQRTELKHAQLKHPPKKTPTDWILLEAGSDSECLLFCNARE